jgi:Uma2 family endonuclease
MDRPSTNSMFREEPARFNVDEFVELASLPPLADKPGKVELVDGVIVHVSPARKPHAKYQAQLFAELLHLCAKNPLENWTVLVELSLRLSAHTMRDPDVLVIRDQGDSEDYGSPKDVLLVVEIAYTTLDRDLGPKRIDYATAGIPTYWVVDVVGLKTICFSQPVDGDYQARVEIAFGEPLAVPGLGEVILID